MTDASTETRSQCDTDGSVSYSDQLRTGSEQLSARSFLTPSEYFSVTWATHATGLREMPIDNYSLASFALTI